ncbi:MAG: Type I Iterative PKS [Bathelium mastoideum]|nr:MAG: Type I Iterative PKS [Bathelium mastoideum]KAI9683024.1 MAG: Type I Iterative PKS [Bathelium mastoideum]
MGSTHVISSEENRPGLVSAAFFCPQARAPDEAYLTGLHTFLSQHIHGQILLKEITALKTDDIWTIFAQARSNVAALSQGPEYVDMLHDWAAEGICAPLAAARSGIVALPLLLILQVAQYLQYLDYHGLSHREFLAGVREAGGLQGYCGGLPSAMAIACAKDESDVIKHAATAVRVLLGIGAYGEAADDSGTKDSTTLALRLKYEGQGDDLTRPFPGTYVSAITEPRSVSIVGPSGQLHELFIFARDREGLQVQKMEVRGKVHNPENELLAKELCKVCAETPSLRLPDAAELQVRVRSNRSGQALVQGMLSEELVTTILASRCEWYSLLEKVAKDLKQAQRNSPAFVYFGLTDCVPLPPFHKRGIRPTKSAAYVLIRTNSNKKGPIPVFPDNAIAVVGASCRLPGANSLEELWNMLASGTDQHQELPTDRFDLPGSFRATQSGNSFKDRKFYGNFLDDVQRFDNAFFGVNAREAANLDPQQRILLELAHEALDDSGYLVTHRREDGDNVGCFIGASFVEYLDNTNAYTPTAYTSTGTIRAFLCGRLSYYYGWSGPAEVIDTACSSSLVAINRACKAVQSGECHMALTGGINIITGINNYFDLAKAGFLSPTGQCKPFDISADGYCRSDGAGLVVVKRLKHAIADGDSILGVVPGIATNQGGLSTSITIPHSAAQQALYRNVLDQARIAPESVTYVETHGTGTQAGDPLEIESIRSIFARKHSKSATNHDDESLYVGSIKGNIGHCETAAGVAGLLKVLAMIKHGQMPPQANHRQLNPKIAPLEPDGLAIARSLRPWNSPFRAALVNSYGAAGSNCALLCCGFDQKISSYREVIPDDMPALPLMLSASSEKSLIENARALATYLRKAVTSKLDLNDVAFTLIKKRRRFKFMASIEAQSSSEAADLLLDLKPSAIFEPFPSLKPTVNKPVVLLFSGQYDNKVGLDRSFYTGYPAFRAHVDACDSELKALGYPSIIPTIFETQPLDDDVVALQCSIFTMQYASARCWLEAGVQPSALVGHSLGELTALAVSQALSLSDAMKLVAARAHLIESKVGPERGGMLALSSCSLQDLESLRTLLHQRSSNSRSLDVEIACYNAPDALVVAGTSASIGTAEDLLRSEQDLRNIRVRRLATSHGFHSSLMDPILPDLDTLTQSLTWHEPKFPLEVCAPQPLRSIKEYSPSRHARDAVLFSESICRVEEKLDGSGLVWLEAGVNTPVTSMAAKATRQTDAHTFLALKTQGSPKPSIDAIAGLVSRLWRQGIFANHWKLIRGCNHIWLPPYQFEATRHWLPNIDRVMEMKHAITNSASTAVVSSLDHAQASSPPQLVTKKTTSSSAGFAEFLINTQCERFQAVVGGHGVRSRALCPASMYMECVTMAFQLHLKGSDDDLSRKGVSLVYENFSINAPLGAKPEGEVVLQLKQVANSWEFSVTTLVFGADVSKKPRGTSHAKGFIAFRTSPDLDAVQRLVSEPIERLERLDNADAERLMSKRSYGLFGRVVDYATFFRGIRSITLAKHEAVAIISLAHDQQPNRDQSTAWKVCDTVTIDAYIQVVGLLMNSDDSVSAEDVVVMTGLDRVILSPACKMDNPCEYWRVYARFGFGSDQQPLGDVFVCTANGELVAMLTGCRFAKLPISRLEKILDMANQGSSAPQKEKPIARGPSPPPLVAPPSSDSSSAASESTGASTLATDLTTPSPSRESSKVILALRELVAEYTGIEPSGIPEDKMLADLGLDSLASVELIGELSSKFGVAINEDVGQCTLQGLYRQLGTKSPPIPVSLPDSPKIVVPTPTMNDPDDRGDLDGSLQKFLQILVDVSGARPQDIKPQEELANLGIDSLSSVDLKQELEDNFAVRISDITVESTVQELMTQLGISVTGPKSDSGQKAISPESVENSVAIGAQTGQDASRTVMLKNPFEILRICDSKFDSSARKNGFTDYWSDVAPAQNELLLAYVIEAYKALGVDLNRASAGTRLPEISYQSPKHDKVVRRLWEILQAHAIVKTEPSGRFTRAGRALEEQKLSAAELQMAFEESFPAYNDEASLIGLTGPRLAECLSGQLDAVSLMFSTPASMKIMQNYYGQSPMISTMTDQLVVFLVELLKTVSKERPVRILEVGAGTGGTTKRLASGLEDARVTVRYTFTDISPSLVSKAKNTTLKQHASWMDFSSFNMEKEVQSTFRGQYDIVIGTNCVHATSDQIASCRRLRETLVPGGIIVLSEVTRIIDWYDICFGLLDGWWLAEGGTAYPIRPAETWMSYFNAAGFSSASCSGGLTKESTSQQLLVACNEHWDVHPLITESISGSSRENHADGSFKMETMVYKEVDGVEVRADVFFPTSSSSSPMPIALMIHGGGHMTLSRRAIRPPQTQHLLANGFLPVSIDYRLCPEVSLVDGPITDVCDAYNWVRTTLPRLATARGITVKSDKVVVIGWSTGGHLAVSLGWAAKLAGLPPPTAILSFYAPYDFESGELDSARLASLPGRKISLKRIVETLPTTPITTYENSAQGDSTSLGWVRPGDPRSELVLALFKEGIGLSLLLNGLPSRRVKNNDGDDDDSQDWIGERPSSERIASISPLMRLLAGQYHCPTFVVHGTADEVAPFTGAQRFVEALAERGVAHGFLPVQGAPHIHDLHLRPGRRGWEEQVGPGYDFLFHAVS